MAVAVRARFRRIVVTFILASRSAVQRQEVGRKIDNRQVSDGCCEEPVQKAVERRHRRVFITGQP